MSGEPVEGLLLVDKPTGWTSHDVVARVRRLAGTRRVGHAGTLDPLATGLLLVGVGRATRLLGHLALHDKEYSALIRLGAETSTDDREGEPIRTAAVDGVLDEAIRRAAAALTGELSQVPPGVSAIKIDGQRAYARVRAGESVEMPPRQVRVTEFEVSQIRRESPGMLEVQARISCSSGTYVRALARDLGRAVGSAGHLAELRRTRVGGYRIEDAHTLEALGEQLPVTSLAEAAARAFPAMRVTAEQAKAFGHGIGVAGLLPAGGADPVAVLGPDGSLVALVRDEAGMARPLAVFAAQ